MNAPGGNDDPNQIITYLIEEHGIDGAIEQVRKGVSEAHATGDNYRLSVWREVRRLLRDHQRDAGRADPPAA
jgi:hypothetical protein